MADKAIGELPAASAVQDADLIPVQQGGSAKKMTGAQFRQWAQSSVSQYVSDAQEAAQAAGDAAETATSKAADAARDAGTATTKASEAASSASAAQSAWQSTENMQVAVNTLPSGSAATVTKSQTAQGIRLTFGIPTGPQGAGVPGPQGPTGGNTYNIENTYNYLSPAAIEAQAAAGMYYFSIGTGEDSQGNPEAGHLLLVYSGSQEPDMYIDNDPSHDTYGHLLWEVD